VKHYGCLLVCSHHSRIPCFFFGTGKGKVVPVLILTEHYALKAQVGSGEFLTSALDGGEWSASRPGRFTPKESPWYPLDRRLCGARAGPDAVVKR